MYVTVVKTAPDGRVEKYAEFPTMEEADAHVCEYGGIVAPRPGEGSAIEWRVTNGALIYDPYGPSHAEINAERDLRLDAGFRFQGQIYDSDDKALAAIAAFGGLAQAAIAAGADPGDYRWSDTDRDFEWVTSDNQLVKLDAHQVLALSMAAIAHKQRVITAARRLKNMDDPPKDITSDEHWT